VDLDADREVAVPSTIAIVLAPGNEGGYGYSVAPYAAAYRSTLRTTRIRRTTRGGFIEERYFDADR